MDISQEPIFMWLYQFAYEPQMIYLGIVGMMMLSAVGFPLPEEVTLISVGILAFMGGNPEMFPPPYEGAKAINVHEAALICFLSVYFADFLIYFVGRKWGRKLLFKKPFSRFFPIEVIHKVEAWIHKYGTWACGIFRFTPGIRFPGHLITGMMKFSAWKFALVDGVAAGISVPTQIYLVAHYGEPILSTLRQFKIIIFSALGAFIFLLLVYKLIKYFKSAKPIKETESVTIKEISEEA